MFAAGWRIHWVFLELCSLYFTAGPLFLVFLSQKSRMEVFLVGFLLSLLHSAYPARCFYFPCACVASPVPGLLCYASGVVLACCKKGEEKGPSQRERGGARPRVSVRFFVGAAAFSTQVALLRGVPCALSNSYILLAKIVQHEGVGTQVDLVR